MAIKPVTFAGAANLSANLYALELRARFPDRSAANGYYPDYGEELAASIEGCNITIGRGAFLVQGRLCEITEAETVTVDAPSGSEGYLCARIDTYRTQDGDNCVLVARTAPTLSAVTLVQQDTYASVSETESRVYELPLYAFSVKNGAVADLTRLIKPITAEARDAFYKHHVTFSAMKMGDGNTYEEYCVFCDLILHDATPARDEEALRTLLAAAGETICTGYVRRYEGELTLCRTSVYRIACNLMKDQLGPAENTGTIRLFFLSEDADGTLTTKQADIRRDDDWVVTVTDNVY